MIKKTPFFRFFKNDQNGHFFWFFHFWNFLSNFKKNKKSTETHAKIDFWKKNPVLARNSERGKKGPAQKWVKNPVFRPFFDFPEGERQSPTKLHVKKSRFCQSHCVFGPCFFWRFLLFFHTCEKMAFLSLNFLSGFPFFGKCFFSELKIPKVLFLRLNFL